VFHLKTKNIVVSLLVCTSLFIIPFFTQFTVSDIAKPDMNSNQSPRVLLPYISHSTITITGNSDFVSQLWPGEGTSDNPFRITGLNITSETSTCILISNTTSYFVISDCWLSTHDSDWGVGAITLEKVVHAQIENNVFASGHIAMSVKDSSRCTIIKNEIGTSLMGFLAYNMTDSEFSENSQISEAIGYPVHIQDGKSVFIRSNIFQNSVYEGIGLAYCTNCYLESNVLSGGDLHSGQYGFAIRSSQFCVLRENNVTGCGTAIDIAEGLSNTIEHNIIRSCWGGVVLRGNETLIYNNDIKATGFCVQLVNSFNCVVQSNQLQSIIAAIGIDVNGGGFSNLTNNILERHEYGIRLQGTRNLTVCDNEFSNCFLAITFEEIAYVGLEDGAPINCRIVNNNLHDGGIGFSITDPTSMNHEIVGNLVAGKKLGYFYDAINKVIDGQDYGRIILVSSNEIAINGGILDELTILFSSNCEVTGIAIENQTNGIYIRQSNQVVIGYSEVAGNEVGIRVELSNYCSFIQTVAYNNGHGVLLDSSPNSTVYDCDLFENEYGIVLIGAHDSHIASNRIYKNQYGIYLLRTLETFIGNNEVIGNDEIGILLNRGSRFNRIIANSFGWNSINAICSGFDNIWDDGIDEGNRWSDLGEDYIYMIDEDDMDRFPSSLGNETNTNTLPAQETITNNTRYPGAVTPEIATITGASLLCLVAFAILVDRKRE
jgi:parallel beta-helix repeat protein